MNQKLSPLENLRSAIEYGTYNIDSSEINHADAGTVLTMEIDCSEELIDFVSFNELVQSKGCVITQISARGSIVGFFIEEKIE